MRYIPLTNLQNAVYHLAIKQKMINAKITKEDFFKSVTKHMTISEYCELVVRALKQKGVWMEDLYRRMALCETNSEKRRLKKWK